MSEVSADLFMNTVDKLAIDVRPLAKKFADPVTAAMRWLNISDISRIRLGLGSKKVPTHGEAAKQLYNRLVSSGKLPQAGSELYKITHTPDALWLADQYNAIKGLTYNHRTAAHKAAAQKAKNALEYLKKNYATGDGVVDKYLTPRKMLEQWYPSGTGEYVDHPALQNIIEGLHNVR